MTGRKRKEARKTSTHLRTFKFAVKKLTRVVYKILMPKTLRLQSRAQRFVNEKFARRFCLSQGWLEN
jgi:hypothetical protein